MRPMFTVKTEFYPFGELMERFDLSLAGFDSTSVRVVSAVRLMPFKCR